MTTRIVEGKKPYTGGEAIEIDENKVISLRLRDGNNLIIYDSGDDEIYVDLQLPDEITPTDAFPVGITTGRVVVDNGWDKAGTIICAKTTSGDVIKLVYADEGTLWIDNGTGTFKQIYFKGDVDTIVQAIYTYIDDNANTKTFFISGTAEEKKEKLGQAIQYYLSGKNPILRLGNTTYTLRDVVVGEFEQGTNDVYTFSSTIKSENGKFWEIVVDVPVTAQGHGSTVSSFTDTKHSAGAVVSTTAPSNPAQGDLWYDTTNDEMKVYDGTHWNSVGTGGGGSDIVYATQAEYNALLPGALTDNKHYFIYTESGGGGGWQPGVNTLLYFPLVSDAVDTVNNVTLTSYGTTNYTEVGGVTSAEFTKSNYLYNDSVNIIPQGNVAKTFSVWAYIKGHNSSWTAMLAVGGAGAGEAFGLGQYENDNDIIMSRSYSTSNRYTPTLNTWTNFVMTYDNSVWTLYVNGQSQVTWNTTAPTSGNSFRISQHIGQTGALIYTFYGNLSNVILEDKERTAQEVSDYYNQTKANYGIS